MVLSRFPSCSFWSACRRSSTLHNMISPCQSADACITRLHTSQTTSYRSHHSTHSSPFFFTLRRRISDYKQYDLDQTYSKISMPALPPLNDPVSIAMAAMVSQTPPHTPPRQIAQKPSKRSARIPDGIRPLRGFSIFHRSISLPAAKPADPATNLCMYCKSMGHWSNDCPLYCTLCAKHNKDARGHTASNCSPMCVACDGLGTIKRHNGDERATEMLALESSVKALSVMALEAKTRVECGAQSSELTYPLSCS